MNNKCFVCSSEVAEYRFEPLTGARVECPVCGSYRLMEQGAQKLIEMHHNGGLDRRTSSQLSAALRQLGARGREPVLTDPVSLLRGYVPPADPLEAVDRILAYVRDESPTGVAFVPLVGHRHYAIAGAEDAAAFEFLASQAVELRYIVRKATDESAYRLTPHGWQRLRSLAEAGGMVDRIFLSHAASDRELAQLVHSEIMRVHPNATVFVASRAGDIRADEDWLSVIQRELRAANTYFVLLTPSSIERPWVWFETGAAWMSGKRLVIARAGEILI